MIISPKDALDIAQKMGLIQYIGGKLIRRPDIASIKLKELFEELQTLYGLIDKCLLSLRAIDLSDQEGLKAARSILMEMEGLPLKPNVGKLRAQLPKIQRIFATYLRTWVDRSGLGRGHEDVRTLFELLDDDEVDYVRIMDSTVDWLGEAAETLLVKLESNPKEAEHMIILISKRANQQRRVLSKLIQDLYQIEGEINNKLGVC